MRIRSIHTPPGWYRVDLKVDGASYRHERSRVTAIVSCAIEQDGREWWHLSIAHPTRLPSYQELKAAKEAFLGDVLAIQIFAPRSEHVNIHPNALHLWHCPGGAAIPDFTRGGKTI